MKKTIEVVAAVIVYERKLLAFQRGAAKFDYVSYKFEFLSLIVKMKPGLMSPAYWSFWLVIGFIGMNVFALMNAVYLLPVSLLTWGSTTEILMH